MSNETTLDKHSASWLSSKHDESKLNEQTKPKWFEEMVKNADNEEDTDKNEINDIFNLKTTNKENKLNQIQSKRRNTLNILQNENQNFLNTLTSKSAKPFLDNSIDNNSIDNKLILDNIDKNNLKNENKLNNDLENELLNKTSSILIKSLENINDDLLLDEEEFIIPNEPSGKYLRIVLLCNWGDENSIGLNGIEIFDLKTFKSLTNSNIKFLNYLDSKPEKLFDQIYRTHDENHIWKQSIETNKTIELKLEFDDIKQIGLIRIWNYNRSRIYSYIGVRKMHIYLDDIMIFNGEIEKANGDLRGDLNKFGDTILYTIDDFNLEQIFKNDTSFKDLLSIN